MGVDMRCIVEGCGKEAKRGRICFMHRSRKQRNGSVTTTRKAANGSCMAWIRSHALHSGDECLIWPFARHASGYPRMRHDGVSKFASRVMCEVVHGPPPNKGDQALHSCGKGADGCVNPKHIRWGSRKENMSDARRHGSISRGEARWNAAINEAVVHSIRQKVAAGWTQRDVARTVGVSPQLVNDVWLRKSWAWVDDAKQTLEEWNLT
jgi:hypothetical protein